MKNRLGPKLIELLPELSATGTEVASGLPGKEIGDLLALAVGTERDTQGTDCLPGMPRRCSSVRWFYSTFSEQLLCGRGSGIESNRPSCLHPKVENFNLILHRVLMESCHTQSCTHPQEANDLIRVQK